MKAILSVLLVLLCFTQASAQCITSNFAVRESRCSATGSIEITTTGGSGAYNYKIEGGNYTSASIINGLQPGVYNVYSKDMISGCEVRNTVTVDGHYVEPSFQLVKKDLTCSESTGWIKVVNETGGLQPFQYQVIAPSPSHVGETSSTGEFYNLSAGEYSIQISDSCGVIRVRQVKIIPYSFDFNYTAGFYGCDSITVSITPTDSNPYTYGILIGTDTVWSNSSSFITSLRHNKEVTLLLKNSCGDVVSKYYKLPKNFTPYINDPIFHYGCDSLEINVSSVGFARAPYYCLYERDTVSGARNLISCNAEGHWKVAYGSYVVRANDGCNEDSVVFTEPFSKGGVELNPINKRCDRFDMLVQAMPKNGPVCLYDENGNKIVCADSTMTSPIFRDLPYGRYCTIIYDPCTLSDVRVCSTIVREPVIKVDVSKYVECTYNQINLVVHVSDSSAPYKIWIYNNTDSLLQQDVFNTNTYLKYVQTNKQRIKVVVEDACGDRDTAYLEDTEPFKVTKSIQVAQKCPGASGDNGSGDVTIYAADNHYDRITPTIIKKDGAAVIINYDYKAGEHYYFYGLQPGKYILRYFLYACDIEIYDTVVINEYSYPRALPTYIYKCDDQSYSLNTLVSGGTSPFSYQIIGSDPVTPSINTTQSTPVFHINNGAAYSLIRVRSIDACGNSAIEDVGILPLQNIQGHAQDTCFFKTMKLWVDEVPGAQYSWYYHTHNDSTLVSTWPSYQTYFTPEKAGLYTCYIKVNDDCIQRNVSFNLEGICYGVMPVDTTQKTIKQARAEGKIKIYPNPSQDVINLEFQKNTKSNYEIKIFNATGIAEYSEQLYGVDAAKFAIHKKFNKGVYVIQITNLSTMETTTLKHLVM